MPFNGMEMKYEFWFLSGSFMNLLYFVQIFAQMKNYVRGNIKLYEKVLQYEVSFKITLNKVLPHVIILYTY